jgi:hypothetical protein
VEVEAVPVEGVLEPELEGVPEPEGVLEVLGVPVQRALRRHSK